MCSDKEVKVRFRHQNLGDLGPIIFSNDTTIAQVKERLLSEWPVDGPFAAETPGSTSEIKLISGGRYAEGGRRLLEYQRDLGVDSETIGTMHLVVRKNDPTTHSGSKDGEAHKCCCTIQ